MNLSPCVGVRPLVSGVMMVHAGPGRGSTPQKLQCFECDVTVPGEFWISPAPLPGQAT